jgi:carboxypeptidase Q
MRRLWSCLLAACAVLAVASIDAQSGHSWLAPLRADADRLIAAATANDFAWQRLAELTDTHGARLSGSPNLTGAIRWAMQTMKADGLQNVRAEPVMVPHWVRGREWAEIVDPPRHALPILGLGGTVSTPPGGVEADVLVVSSLEELRSRETEARGKIVLFNVAYTGYVDTVGYRNSGAREAASHGAIAVLIRSIAPVGLRTTHTGSVSYAADVAPIPAAAVAVEDANRLARLTRGGRTVRLRLVLEGRTEPDVESANVVGEIVGREKPNEIVLLGGHLDSWDVGTGASDDAVGCVVTWEALRLMVKLGIRPRRTVRVVLWTNEENGMRGASAYAEKHAAEASDHVFALESDLGVFAPAVLGFTGSQQARVLMEQIGSLLRPIGMHEITAGGGGADIGPIAQAGRVPTMAYVGDAARFFVIHHTAADTVDRIQPEEVSKAVAAVAVVAYAVAEMPERLPR